MTGTDREAMNFKEAISRALTKKREAQREADFAERQRARTKDGKLRRRSAPILDKIPSCGNCGTDPALGCTDCPPSRFSTR